MNRETIFIALAFSITLAFGVGLWMGGSIASKAHGKNSSWQRPEICAMNYELSSAKNCLSCHYSHTDIDGFLTLCTEAKK